MDQLKAREKGDQVAMFGNLCAQATRVLVCIGEHANDSEFLFEMSRGKSKLLNDVVEHAKASEKLRDAYLPPQLRSQQPEKEMRENHVSKLCRHTVALFIFCRSETGSSVPDKHGT